tara:strand:- start:1484 stop:1666 length:183 start_codon:yes stop_codon:yes gene_type:complete
MNKQLSSHVYADKPKVEFGKTGNITRPFYIITQTESSKESITLTEDEARHLIGVGWAMKK